MSAIGAVQEFAGRRDADFSAVAFTRKVFRQGGNRLLDGERSVGLIVVQGIDGLIQLVDHICKTAILMELQVARARTRMHFQIRCFVGDQLLPFHI